ncbi:MULTISPECIES: hypothetical protein [Alphaproteobacteria]|uniref:hypothetical protein n=1 Tax=Alphaproteobacteria TaxID=28211 RepID=UPI001478E1EF|nr:MULTISPECIES: hypothetical protein [Alphaproteobacteria]
MDHVASGRSNHLLIAALVLAGGLFSVLVFAGWVRFGADIVLTLAENGLSSCL